MKVLNAGYVELGEWTGGDAAVIRNARRCYRSESKGKEADRKLIRHLVRSGHKTPFEAMVFTFDVKAPIFVARQWFRHRIGSFQEQSLRYCEAEPEFFKPEILEGVMGEQGWMWDNHNEAAMELYRTCVASGMLKEKARAVLPLGIYTRFYWTVNGSALLNFLDLRTDKHAQPEIQSYAWAIHDQVSEVAPMAFGEWYSMRKEERP